MENFGDFTQPSEHTLLKNWVRATLDLQVFGLSCMRCRKELSVVTLLCVYDQLSVKQWKFLKELTHSMLHPRAHHPDSRL